MHGNNCSPGYFYTKNASNEISGVIELSFINKNLASKARISDAQSFPKRGDQKNCKHVNKNEFFYLDKKAIYKYRKIEFINRVLNILNPN